MAQVLVIEDEPILANNVCEALKLAGHDATAAAGGEEGIAAAEKSGPDLVLLDLRLPGIDGMKVLLALRQRGCAASIIVMTAYGNVESAVEAMKNGASDYLTKPLDLQELELVIDKALEHRRVQDNLSYFRHREKANSALDQIVGESDAMKAVKRFIERIVSTPALSSEAPPTVLLTGETGTGKDLVARAIHYAGPRCDGPFVHVNCASLPDHLVEAELFGHVKGAFTDARQDKRGLFEVADRGTIFLDEIGHMKPPLQAKLLGTLEHRSIRPVGGTRERQVRIHVIAATNRNLSEAIEAGDFREDLYHRLKVLAVHLPPLHARSGDVMLLAERFLHVYAARFNLPIQGFDDDAVSVLQAYDWPGNVRELSHVIESAVIIADGPHIRRDHLNIQPAEPGGKLHIQLPGEETLALNFAEGCPKLDEIENRIIQAALAFSKHNGSRAARLLGISRDAIRYRIEKFRREHPEATR